MLIQDISMMYDAFQTLMETCKNLLNHDIHVHLKNLTTAATKCYVPKGDNCSLCTKQYINQNETDTVVIFRSAECVNLYLWIALFDIHKYKNEKLSPLQFLAPRTFKIYLYHFVPVIEYKLKNNTGSFNCFAQYWGFDLLSGQYSMHFVYHIKRKMYVHMYINVNNSS